MSVIITDECINCGACAVECPEHAIFFTGKPFLIQSFWFEPLSTDHYFILPELCNECIGIGEVKCISICPMNSIVQTED